MCSIRDQVDRVASYYLERFDSRARQEIAVDINHAIGESDWSKVSQLQRVQLRIRAIQHGGQISERLTLDKKESYLAI